MNLVWEPILAMIMALTSFAIKPNPKAPAADAVLTYAVDDADVMVHADLQPTVIDNYPVLQKLAEDPLIKQNPDLASGLRTGMAQVEGGRAMVKNLMGIDLTTDLTSITGFARIRGPGVPEFVLVVRGKFAADLPQRLVSPMGGKTETIDGRVAGATPDGMMIGLTKDGTLLAGQRDLVAPRLADAWKPAARAKGSAWAQVATVLDQRPFFVLATKPSAAALAAMSSHLAPSFGRDLISQQALAIVSASATGIGWVYQAKDAAFAARMKLASEGWIELMRAAHVAPRGIVELAVAALPSYAGVSPQIDDAIKHRDQILAAVDELTGDGKFQASVTQKGNLVTVTTKGRRISDVVPIGVVVGMAGLGYMAGGQKAQAQATPARPPMIAQPPRPARPTAPTPPKPTPPRPAPAPTR